ncbi:hypothetical protein WN944_009598 [Citrus x changshan-huyou]|uniref:Uncharacterized protein n=1 Tax=Citrus x changshan-huyou TaxID=2935761 RepID=A0AAP0QWC8_9ROSI
MNISSIKMILIVTLVVTASWQLMEVEAREVALNTQSSTAAGNSGTIGETFYQKQQACVTDSDCFYWHCIPESGHVKCIDHLCVCRK